jgi:hypothetical protein
MIYALFALPLAAFGVTLFIAWAMAEPRDGEF